MFHFSWRIFFYQPTVSDWIPSSRFNDLFELTDSFFIQLFRLILDSRELLNFVFISFCYSDWMKLQFSVKILSTRIRKLLQFFGRALLVFSPTQICDSSSRIRGIWKALKWATLISAFVKEELIFQLMNFRPR